MTRGKYSARAANREAAKDNELLRQKIDEIAELRRALAAAQAELSRDRAERDSEVIHRAAQVAIEEKQALRDHITELEQREARARLRDAMLMWEIMHRRKFGRPAPVKLHGDNFVEQTEQLPETADEMRASWEYWCEVHWDIAALFFSDYDEMREFSLMVEGHDWQIAGGKGFSSRAATRNLHVGRLRDLIMDREYRRREYYERIWTARQREQVEPVTRIEAHKHSYDLKEDLVNKFKERVGG